MWAQSRRPMEVMISGCATSLRQASQVLSDVLHWVELRGARGQEDERQVLRDNQMARGVPARAVEQQNGVCASSDGAGDLVEVKLHGLRVGVGQRQRCTGAPRRADGAEQVSALVALIGGLARA